MPTKKKEPVVDLASLDIVAGANKGTEIELKHPVPKKGLGIFISIVGTDSDIFRERSLEKRNRNLESLKSREPREILAEDMDDEGLDTLAHCTTGWRNVTLEGKELPFSVKAAKALFVRLPWIAEQIDKEVGNRANFLS